MSVYFHRVDAESTRRARETGHSRQTKRKRWRGRHAETTVGKAGRGTFVRVVVVLSTNYRAALRSVLRRKSVANRIA